jgi:alpha-L-fucosidase 2
MSRFPFLLLLSLSFLLLPGPGSGAWQSAAAQESDSRIGETIQELFFEEPRSFYHLNWYTPSSSSAGSMPIGNGDIGCNVWVDGGGAIHLTIGKTDAWSENGRLLKLGEICIDILRDARAHGSPARMATARNISFRQRLDLRSGDISIRFPGKKESISVSIVVDANHPVIRINASSTSFALLFGLSVRLSSWRGERRELTGEECHSAYGLHVRPEGMKVFVEPDTLLEGPGDRLTWYHRNERSIWPDTLRVQSLESLNPNLTDPLLNRTFGACIKGRWYLHPGPQRPAVPGPNWKPLVRAGWDPRILLSEQAGTRHEIKIYPLTARTDDIAEWIALLDENIKTIAAAYRAPSPGRGVTSTSQAHRDWWQKFWKRSWIHAGGCKEAEAVTRGYNLQRWINACGGRGGSPIKFNGSIFTAAVPSKGFDADYRRWGGPYWWQNTRLPYWSMPAAGDFDLMEPLFAMYRDALPLARARTAVYYGHEGAFFPETMYFWGTYVNANYGWDREGKEVGLTDNRYIRREWQGGIELVAMMLDRYDFTQDDEFLRTTLLPLAEGIVQFFDRHWERDGEGKIRFNPAQALETWWECTNPMPEVAGLRWILPRLVSLPEEFTTEEQRAAWRSTLAALPELPTGTAEGKRFLLPAEEFAEKRNSENPELYALFPYAHFGPGRPGRDIALETWRRRSQKGTGGWNQNPIQAACLGLTEEAREMVVGNFTTHHGESRFPAFWGPNYDWIPDQDHGGVSMIALQKMVLQTDGEKIFLLPAWPKEWDLDFRLHAPLQTVVTGKIEKGKITALEVEPESRRADVTVAPGWKLR